MTTPDIQPHLGDEAFVQHVYALLLGRHPDPEDLRIYREHLRAGLTRLQIATAIAESGEAVLHAHRAVAPHALRSVWDLLALDGSVFLRQAYQVVLGRDPDQVGVRDYGPRLVAGEAKEQVLVELRVGDEGQAHASRLPGLAELVQAVQQLRGETDAPPTPASVDFLLQLDGDAFVRMAYRTVLRRQVDPDGLYRYRSRLAEGYSKLSVLQALYHSGEAREKGVKIDPLDRRLAAYARAQRMDWGGWFWRHVRGIESDLPRDRELRGMLARLGQK